MLINILSKEIFCQKGPAELKRWTPNKSGKCLRKLPENTEDLIIENRKKRVWSPRSLGSKEQKAILVNTTFPVDWKLVDESFVLLNLFSFFFLNRHDCQQWVQLIFIFLFFQFYRIHPGKCLGGWRVLTGGEKGCAGPTGNPGKLERKLCVCVMLSWQKKLYKMLWLSSEVSESEFRMVVLMHKILASCIYTQSGGVKEILGAFHLPGMVRIWVWCKTGGAIFAVSQYQPISAQYVNVCTWNTTWNTHNNMCAGRCRTTDPLLNPSLERPLSNPTWVHVTINRRPFKVSAEANMPKRCA